MRANYNGCSPRRVRLAELRFDDLASLHVGGVHSNLYQNRAARLHTLIAYVPGFKVHNDVE